MMGHWEDFLQHPQQRYSNPLDALVGGNLIPVYSSQPQVWHFLLLRPWSEISTFLSWLTDTDTFTQPVPGSFLDGKNYIYEGVHLRINLAWDNENYANNAREWWVPNAALSCRHGGMIMILKYGYLQV